jgi:Tfp pilus assembly protein PilF
MERINMFKRSMGLATGLLLVAGTAAVAQSQLDARKAIDAEQFQKAKTMLRALVASNPKDADNYFYLGKVLLLTDEVDSARAIFSNGISVVPKGALNYVGLGQADLIQGNPTNAKTNFDKAIDLKKKDYETFLYIGRAYIDQKNVDYVSALPNLQMADELDKKDVSAEVFLALADYYAMQKKNTDAYPQYLRALDINPKLSRARVQIGKMYKEAYAFPEAETEIAKVISEDPNYGPAYRELSEVQMQWSFADPKNGLAKREDALKNMRKYLDLTDNSFDSRLRYAQFLVYASDFATLEKEVANLNAPDSNNPKTFVVIRMRGYSAIENKNFEQGVKYMDELFARTKDASRIIGSDYLYLGKAQQALGKDSLAYINILKAVKLDSTKVEVLADIAKKFYDGRRYGKAAEVFAEVVKVNSKDPSIATNYFYLGTSNYFKYAFDDRDGKKPSRDLLLQADSAFAKVNQLAPDYETAYLYRARVNKMIDNVDNGEAVKGLAKPYYEKYIEIVTVTKPEKAATAKSGLIECYNNLGAYAATAGDKAKAGEFFNKTLALDPQNAYATDNLKILSPGSAAKPAGKK